MMSLIQLSDNWFYFQLIFAYILCVVCFTMNVRNHLFGAHHIKEIIKNPKAMEMLKAVENDKIDSSSELYSCIVYTSNLTAKYFFSYLIINLYCGFYATFLLPKNLAISCCFWFLYGSIPFSIFVFYQTCIQSKNIFLNSVMVEYLIGQRKINFIYCLLDFIILSIILRTIKLL